MIGIYSKILEPLPPVLILLSFLIFFLQFFVTVSNFFIKFYYVPLKTGFHSAEIVRNHAVQKSSIKNWNYEKKFVKTFTRFSLNLTAREKVSTAKI